MGVANNLRVLRENNGMTRSYFSEKYSIAEETLKSYENGKRKLPIELALNIADDFDITLDWLFCRVECQSEKDTIVHIVFALRKIFTISFRKTPFSKRDVVLLMDKRFKDFLYDIQELGYFEKESIKVDDALYIEQRRKIYEKHKLFLEDIFDEVYFNENQALEIYGIESCNYTNDDDTIFNYLASKEVD